MHGKKILVFGATGALGRQILQQGLAAGANMTAFVRDPRKLTLTHENLSVIAGDATYDRETVAAAICGQDAVISALGNGMSLRTDGLMQRCVLAIRLGMQKTNVKRLILTSAFGVGESMNDASALMRVVYRLLMKQVFEDKAASEDQLRRSDLDWTIVYPVMLTNGPRTESYRVGEKMALSGLATISRADVADFILKQLADTKFVRKAAVVTS
jgi:putative NADH-flavin reductase